MKLMKHLVYIVLGFIIFALHSCTGGPGDEISNIDKQPHIFPDYKQITIPVNIAPLNFMVEEAGDDFYIDIDGNSKGGIKIQNKKGEVKISTGDWRKLLEANESLKISVALKKEGEWFRYNPFTISVAKAKIDPFLYYRLLHPGYESWSEISIMQRSTESFNEKTVVKNNVVDQNCVNCHAFNQQNTDNFMFHMRGSMGGTYFVENGDLKKFNLKTKEMKNGAVYPRWHPSGKFVAFSSNKVVQQFHSKEKKKIEVSDLNSSLVLYDLENNEMQQIQLKNRDLFMDTYPEWSPDGNYLYFCRADQIPNEYDYRDTRYNLCRVKFDANSKSFGEVELIYNAKEIGKSISFPRISPDGKTLVFTLHNYGCFPIWHKEADLVSINLSDNSENSTNVNSEFTESYHSWSSNGEWMVFSSKRGDGLTARPYISYVDKEGKMHKPFVLPQKDPGFYKTFIKTYNIPELTQTEVSFTPGEIKRAAKQTGISAQWSEN